jgi:predicted amidophosphoribosyltransferase
MFCEICGMKISEGERFCSGCGANVPTAIATEQKPAFAVCAKCGARLAAGELFCSTCGAKVQAGQNEQKTEAESMICTNCKKELKKEWVVCPYCGMEVGPKLCPKCGKELEEGWVVCPFCKAEV